MSVSKRIIIYRKHMALPAAFETVTPFIASGHNVGRSGNSFASLSIISSCE